MDTPSYLLMLDSSLESLCAAKVCQKIAERTGASVTALSIIDTTTVSALVKMELPGLIGSGPHIVARDQIMRALYEMAETVQLSYKARFAPLVKDEKSTIIAQGDPVEVIASFYPTHELVIMGQRTASNMTGDGSSLSEKLVSEGGLPILVVQSDMGDFATVYMMGGTPAADALWISSMVDLTSEELAIHAA